jgi:hypothetical protein
MHVVTRRDVEDMAKRLASFQEKCEATGAHQLDLRELDAVQAKLLATKARRRQLLHAFAFLPPFVRQSYLRASRRLRLSSRKFGLEWYTIAVISGAVFFVAALLLALLYSGSATTIALAASLAFFIGFGLFAVFLLFPSQKQLENAMDLDAYNQQLLSRLRHLQYLDRVRRAHEQCRKNFKLISERFKSRQNQLLMIDWRSLRGVEFENFLADVFQALGYAVETTKASGDQGIDLIASKNGKRIGIQAKGYAKSVGNSAVQEAFAGKTHYGCDECVVITNSRFTRGAGELAVSTGCLLLSGSRIPALINGKVF